jgi:hypothetical protein
MLQSVPFTSKFDEYVLVKLSEDGSQAASREGGGTWDATSMYGAVAEPGVQGAHTHAVPAILICAYVNT